jgi:hypothetical protein
MDFEESVDELYGAPLEGFVSTRSGLAKALRDAGSSDDAQALAQLRKPTLPAWVLNQLARRDRRDIGRLLEAGDRLRRAQAGLLGGADQGEFEAARAAERDVVARLLGESERLLQGRGSSPAAALNEIEQTLRNAAVSEEGRELLSRGRFTKTLGSRGFDLVGELAASAPRTRQGRTGNRTKTDRERRRRAQRALEEARARLRSAERDARAARTEADRLAVETKDAARVADRAERTVATLRAEVARAEALLSRRAS